MFTLGGLCSFYQFAYHDIRIILLGEIHDAMSRELVGEYLKFLDEYINDSESIQIILESIDGEEKNHSEQLSFMEGCLLLSSPNLTVTHADKRYYNEEFTDLFLFFKNISELPSSKISYFDNPKFSGFLHEIAENYNKSLNFSGLFNLLHSEIGKLNQLVTENFPTNLHVEAYTQSCIKNLGKALALVKDLEKECCSASKDGLNKESDSILDICIERMEQTKSFEIIIAWLEIYYLYEIYHFDATLLADFWLMIHQEKNKNSTFIIVTGDTHTKHLANILQLIATPINSMTSAQQENRISPDSLKELLNSSMSTKNQQSIFK